ncbi:MAG TPA: hypothetical protein VJ596_00640 [Gemmatimonadaceae bacterium]|nr:hypothetical protein [Gemmatimonadaceae bacterium]
MPHQYRIEKQRLAISLRLLGGQSVEGDMFLQPSPYGYSGGERAVDVLNARASFVPVELDDGSVLLVQKDRVIEVRGDGLAEEDEIRLAIAIPSPLEITMTDGTLVEGSLMLEVPHDRQRALDYLNDCRMRFLTVYTSEGARLVNSKLIELARPLT